MFKKISAITLSLLLVLSFTSCGKTISSVTSVDSVDKDNIYMAVMPVANPYEEEEEAIPASGITIIYGEIIEDDSL